MRALYWTALAFPLMGGCTSDPEAKETPGVFVLGVDGMDPVILQRLVDEVSASYEKAAAVLLEMVAERG